MKKHSIYIGLAALAGLFAGYLIFGGNAEGTTANDHPHAEVTEPDRMWTCSMHPQIMQLQPGDCPICGMDLIPVEADAEGLSTDQFEMTENAMALANIRTTVAGAGETGENSLRLSGKIRENEETNAVQVSYFAGRIEKLYINFTGEKVSKGQLLAVIYSPELVSAQQELLTAAALKASQPALYSAVRNKLKLWKLSEEQINRIEASGNVTENFPMYATVSGTVTAKMASEGDYVKQGQPLYKIADLNTVWAAFDAYENQIALLKKGQRLTITTNAYPGQKFDAEIAFIDPVLNAATRTVTVRAVLKNGNNIFKPGMFVEARIEAIPIQADSIISIPASAVLWTGTRSVVYIKTDPHRPVFEMREVTLGGYTGESYTVLSGLNAGETIVTNGTFTVDAAAQLQGKKSMMNEAEGKTAVRQKDHKESRNGDPGKGGS
ncbi:MAG: efflux RND transporter periplasmic adaptor subunit, partial [Sinomicrobium sp.]|nr:efflux RND transporter periplasmic adaptor subunit [Sinomicrobium sp.]